MKKIVLFFVFYFLFSIFIAEAALVPCGTSDTDSCTFCDLARLGQNIINFALYLVFPISAIMIVVGGIFILTAGGSEARVSKGREIITAAIVGLLIALFSWLILDTIFRVLANTQAPEGFKTEWYKIGGNINC